MMGQGPLLQLWLKAMLPSMLWATTVMQKWVSAMIIIIMCSSCAIKAAKHALGNDSDAEMGQCHDRDQYVLFLCNQIYTFELCSQ